MELILWCLVIGVLAVAAYIADLKHQLRMEQRRQYNALSHISRLERRERVAEKIKNRHTVNKFSK